MKRNRTFAFILHGSRAGQDDVRRLVEWVRERGHEVHPRVTWEAGDAVRYTREAIACNVDAVVAVGGDGTVNEVINGLDGSSIPLGIIPVGTANDFAKAAGLPGDVDHAMDVILRHAPVRMDTGEVNGRRFINASVGGLGAEATAETPPEAKELLGRFAYAITGVRKLADLTPARGRFTGENLALECEFLLFAVGNMATTGGGTLITPHASVSDGLLDLMVVKAMPRAEFARLLPRIRKGDHVGADGVVYVQVPAVKVESDSPITINADGEPMHSACAEYRCRPGDLMVHLPRIPAPASGNGGDEAA